MNGGLPINLTGNIFLCGRDKGNDSRGFDGQLTELLLFDSSLTGEQVEALYWIGVSPSLPSKTYSIGKSAFCQDLALHCQKRKLSAMPSIHLPLTTQLEHCHCHAS